jgi:hypothetical protein
LYSKQLVGLPSAYCSLSASSRSNKDPRCHSNLRHIEQPCMKYEALHISVCRTSEIDHHWKDRRTRCVTMHISMFHHCSTIPRSGSSRSVTNAGRAKFGPEPASYSSCPSSRTTSSRPRQLPVACGGEYVKQAIKPRT